MKTEENNPWAAMDAIVNNSPQPMGDGWFSTQEYTDRYKCTRDSAYNRLNRMKGKGVLEQWSGNAGPNGHIMCKWRVKPVSSQS